MPPLHRFSDNSFETYADFQAASVALLDSLKPYQSRGGARIRLPLQTGTHFDDVAAQLEGFARPLWAVGALLHDQSEVPESLRDLIGPYITGLANGTDPQHPEFWGPVVLRDQRMVEMEIISFALLSAPDAMFHNQSEKSKKNITAWLKTINGKDFPTTNWLWFRVMTNLALIKVCGVPAIEVLDAMKADLDLMEQFYLGQGWAADGTWSDDGRQADYYSGSFAIQFSQLIYAKVANDLDPERCERFRSRAREFAMSFWRYFDANGAAIPFGRSLTYRFALAGFFSVVAFAEVELPAPLDDWGVVKGLLSRHFRWWSDKDDMFNVDGTLTIGFAYPNMYMSEDYNSPQSAYWSMKSFVALGLPENHPFWAAKEKPLPQSRSTITQIQAPMHVICSQRNHHFLLSTGQFCPWPLKATEAKYGKFAYSSHFGFSVPTGSLIQQMAPDSTLAVSKDGGDTWRVPWKVSGHRFGTAQLYSRDTIAEIVSVLTSTWRPWKDADIQIETFLVAPCKRWPDWYVRWHRVKNGSQVAMIHAVQGGFAIQGRGAKLGEVLPRHDNVGDLSDKRHEQTFAEGTIQSAEGAMVSSSAGTSGIRPLPSTRPQQDVQVAAEVLKPDANTNLIWQRTLIPTLRAEIRPQEDGCSFGSAVFALARTSDRQERYAKLDIAQLWNDVPLVRITQPDTSGAVDDYLLLQVD
ncbi:hypothetical protein ACN47E_002159 [Coniothyrium glycines]